MNTLTHFRLCPLSRSIRLALNEHDIAYQIEERHAWEGEPEFLALNPAGELPVLQLGSGEVLCGCYAIAEYVSETYSEDQTDRFGAVLFPGTAEDKAEVRRLVDWFHRKFYWEVSQEVLIDKIQPLVSRVAQASPPEAERIRAVRRNLQYHMSYICYLIDQRSWLAGEEASYADLAAAAHLSVLDYVGDVSWDKYPVAKDWYVRIKSRPSFRPFLQERITGPEPPPHYGELDF